MHRAYSLLEVKSLDSERRVITGMATTPTPDRDGDIIEPLGVKFKNPLPLLLYHDAKRPVGHVTFQKPTKKGIPFEARIPKIDEPGIVKDRVDEAWQSVKAGLISGTSIGFRPNHEKVELLKSGGFHFHETEVFELSLVVIPANAEATIATVKSLDSSQAVTGVKATAGTRSTAAGDTAFTPQKRRDQTMSRTASDRLTALKTERTAIAEKMKSLMQPVIDETGELDENEQKQYDDFSADLDEKDAEIKRLQAFERASVIPKALPVVADTADAAAESRSSRRVIVKDTLPPGIEFARYLICKGAANVLGVSPLDVAKTRFPDHPRIQSMFKAAVAGATTTDATWAAPLLQDVRTLTSEFLDYLRPKTIVGRFGTDGIPALTRVGFYERVQSQTTGGSANWVGQAVQKPVTKFDFEAITTLPTKIAAISVLSDELVRFSSPSAESRVRDALTKIIVERMDRDFIDPDKAVSANVSPASITNGITGLTPSSGGDADDVRADVAAMLGAFIGTNQNVQNLVWIMSGTTAMQAMMMRNSLGQQEFPGITVNGGTFFGFPVIVSQYAAVVGSPTQNIVVLVNPNEIFLADDGGVSVDMSREATIEMSDDPANESGTQVNMYQTNQVALKAERYVYWVRGRVSAVAWLDGVAWSAAA